MDRCMLRVWAFHLQKQLVYCPMNEHATYKRIFIVVSRVEPLAEITVPPLVAALPKADLHLHAEADARIDRVLAQRAGRRPYDWRSWAQQLLVEVPVGM